MDHQYAQLLEALDMAKPPSGHAELREASIRALEQTRYRVERYLLRFRASLPPDRSRFLRQAVASIDSFLVDHAAFMKKREAFLKQRPAATSGRQKGDSPSS